MKPRPMALIIDAERPIRRLLRVLLEAHCYKTCEADDGYTGLLKAVSRRPDVIILDMALPDIPGLTVLQRLRESNQVPVLVLSEQNSEADMVMALDSGANDYMTKPFGSSELLARLRVLQRPILGEPDSPLFVHGGLQVDFTSHRVTIRGREINLTPTEEAVFYTLVRNAGKLVTCNHLLRCVWGTESENTLHELKVYISHLRRKLHLAAENILIKTEDNFGYRLLLPSDKVDPIVVDYKAPQNTIHYQQFAGLPKNGRFLAFPGS